MGLRKSDFEAKNADSVKAGDEIYVYGDWLVVQSTRHVNHHPYQLYEFYLSPFRGTIKSSCWVDDPH